MNAGTKGLCVAMSALVAEIIGGAAAAATLNESQKLVAEDVAEEDFFGFSVAVDGDIALVGAEFDDDNGEDAGAAYVFARNAGVWTQQQKLVASDGSAGDFFGYSVALDGNTAVIGARRDDNANGSGAGSAYVFVLSGGSWSEQQKLTASDGEAFDDFGGGVDIDGDSAVIGAIGHGVDGAVFAYVRSAGVWTEEQKLMDTDGADSDAFGAAVAIDGQTLLVGAPHDADLGFSSGSVYVFSRTAGVWTQQQHLLPGDGALLDSFGGNLSLKGDAALIGAALDDDNGPDSGSAYFFTRSAGVWSEQQKLLASDGAAGDQFGDGVVIAGNSAIVGAFQDDDNGADSGSAYLWSLEAGTWTERDKLLASDGAADDFFGRPLALDGRTAVIGAYFHDAEGNASGGAYIFDLVEDVGIDILPKNDTNKINLRRPRIPVAILSSPTFDALQVKVSTVTFGPVGANAIPWLIAVHDVDHDGLADLILWFRTKATGIQCGDTEAELTGETHSGEALAGADSITTIGCR